LGRGDTVRVVGSVEGTGRRGGIEAFSLNGDLAIVRFPRGGHQQAYRTVNLRRLGL
jgi:hypothetical protein